MIDATDKDTAQADAPGGMRVTDGKIVQNVPGIGARHGAQTGGIGVLDVVQPQVGKRRGGDHPGTRNRAGRLHRNVQPRRTQGFQQS